MSPVRLVVPFAIFTGLAAGLACNTLTGRLATATSSGPEHAQTEIVQTQAFATVSPFATPVTAPFASPTPVLAGGQLPTEAILILEPGLTSRIASPVRVAGFADPTFEQALVVELVGQDGSALVEAPTTIGADVGLRGPFSIDLEFSVAEDQPGRIVVYTTSPRDGGVIHLASVEVTLLAGGASVLLPSQTHAEDITIHEPAADAVIAGGVILVTGFSSPTFEQNLVIDITDGEGNVVGATATTILADAGAGGPFRAELTYVISAEQPGRVTVYSVSARDGGVLHLSSREITLRP